MIQPITESRERGKEGERLYIHFPRVTEAHGLCKIPLLPSEDSSGMPVTSPPCPFRSMVGGGGGVQLPDLLAGCFTLLISCPSTFCPP